MRQSSRSDAKNYKEESGSEVEDDDDEVFDYYEFVFFDKHTTTSLFEYAKQKYSKWFYSDSFHSNGQLIILFVFLSVSRQYHVTVIKK